MLEGTIFHEDYLRSEQPESPFFNSNSQKNTRRKQTPILRPLLEVPIEICNQTSKIADLATAHIDDTCPY